MVLASYCEGTKLVFALGYLVHELHEPMPAMPQSSLETVDADRSPRSSSSS